MAEDINRTSKPGAVVPAIASSKSNPRKVEIPIMEIPATFRELAEKNIAQTKEHYEKLKAAAEQATDVLESTYANASKGYSGFGLKLIENTRTNTDAAFGLMAEVITAKSYAEVVELTSGFWRKQFNVFAAQTKDIAEQAQKVAAETAAPIRESFGAAMKKAA